MQNNPSSLADPRRPRDRPANASPAQTPSSPPRLRRAAHLIALAALAAAALATFVRLTVRDRWPILSAWFYATPPLVIAAICLTACVAGALARRPRLAALALAGAASAAGWGAATSWVSRQPQRCDDSVRVMFWNVNRGWLGWSGIAARIRDADADVVGLVEARFADAHAADAFNARLPHYTLLDPVFGIMLLTKGECLQVVDDWLPPAGKYRRVHLRIARRDLEVWVVDLESNPFGARADTFRRLAHKIENFGDRPLVVMGDFNTPSDSLLFDAIRRHAVNAFEAAGRGYQATWPVPAPVLTLDQVWVNPRVEPLAARLEWSWRSDHRAPVVDLHIRP